MKINTTLLKYIGILAMITLLSAIGVRVFTGGESLSDYAEKNPEVAYSEPIPEDDEASLITPSGTGGATQPTNAAPAKKEVASEDDPKATQPFGADPSHDSEKADAAKKDSPTESYQNEITDPKGDHSTMTETTTHETAKNATDANSSLSTPNDIPARTVYKEGFYYEELPEDVIDRITGISYKENPHITLDDLRYVKVLYHDFSSETQVGELICNQAIAQDLTEIFYELYQNEYQIERIALVDEYDGDDTLSMEANNTSCFNYRVVDGTTRLSKHALGLAIDINPYYNPYIVYNKDGTGETYISPKGSEIYADRSQNFPYKIDSEDLCYRLFKEHGFTWGGNWNSTKDYQHFQKAID